MNTPTKTRGLGAGAAADLTYWESAARMIAECCTTSKVPRGGSPGRRGAWGREAGGSALGAPPGERIAQRVIYAKRTVPRPSDPRSVFPTPPELPQIIVEKSTVPVKTAEAVEKVVSRNCKDTTLTFDVLSNPEFLAEASLRGGC